MSDRKITTGDHTPGPWRVDRSLPDDRPHVVAPDGFSPMDINYRPLSEVEANAALYASAPALYAAVEEMLAAYWGEEGDGIDPEPRCIQNAKRALKLARGEK